MLNRLLSGIAILSLLSTALSAQTVRFDTNVGTIDFELNPTGNANLQGHVDNMLAYVNAGRYDNSVINRAVERVAEDPTDDFVLQMGGFLASGFTIPNNFSDLESIDSFDPVIVDADNDGTVDFDVSDLLNTRGTVSLALSSSSNTGTSSFFVNLSSNTTLDIDQLRFIPFARVNDLSTIDLIMSLSQQNYEDGSLAGDDFPFFAGNRAVIVERAFVLDQSSPVELASSMGPVDPLIESSTASEELIAAVANVSESFDSEDPSEIPIIHHGAQIAAVPEPSTLMIAVGGLLLMAANSRKRVL